MVSFVKNWFKSWALWVWALFISLLASESELLPKLQSAEIKEDIPKKKIIIKKKKKVKKNEVSENEGKIEEAETDREGKGQEDQDICLSSENVTHEEESEIYVTDENVVLKGSEIHVIDESLVLESKNSCEIEIVLPETDNLVDDTVIESEENSDNNEEDNIPWIGAGRGSGLTRYSGVQNLMDTEEDNDQPLVVERRAPMLIPRREGGPLTLTRGSLIKSLSHEKVRLEEIPEEDRHPSPRNVESALEDTDKIWAQLVARYTEANSVEKRNQDGSDTFDNKFIKDSVRDFTDENMTSKEFSDEVGKRLQMYLEMVGDNVELLNNRREEGTNEIEDENEKDLGLSEDGKHKIFIMIEDDESSGDKEEIDDVFSKDYMDIKVSTDHSEADIQEHFEKNDEEKNFEEIEPEKVLECEQLGLGEDYYDEREETQTQKANLLEKDENAIEITQTPNLITLETVDSITKEETTDYPSDFDNINTESEPLVEVQETASKDEEAPVFTIKIRKKSKPTITESELLSESSTLESSSNVKNEDPDRAKEKEESVHQDSKSVVEDVPAVTFILPKKKKKKEIVEEKKIEEKTENQKLENADLSLSADLQSTDMKGGLLNEYHDSSVTNTRGEKREGETVDPYNSKRRSSRDLWKMEVEKFLEYPNTSHRERTETDKGEDIFSTRFEEFPEDYIVEEDISDHPITESNDDKFFVEESENTDFEHTTNISEDHVETKESTSKVSEFQGEQIESEKDGKEKDNTFKDNDFEISANKRKLDENISEEILETNLTKDLDINEEKSSKKLKDDMEYFQEESEPPCKIEVPKPVQLIDVCDILTNSEQNLVARILTQKNKDDVEESLDYDSEQSSVIEFKEEFSKDEPASPKTEEFTDKLEDEGQEIVECALVEEDKLPEHLDTDEKLLSIKSQELEHEASPAEVLSTVPKSEKDVVLESIRKERDSNTKDFVDDSDLPDYLEDVKDLLVPRVRRKKTRRCDPLNEILKIKEPDHDKTSIATSSKDNILDFNKTHEEDMNEAASLLRKKASDDNISRQNDEFSLTEEELKELEEINKEQEAYRAAQRKELEKFLAMPAALTKQEQRELEEFLAEEETDKVAIAGSEARLEALLSEVRKRLAESGMDVDDENLDRYMTLPTDLTEEEERLLSIDDDEEEEKGRNDFDSEEDYREYIKQRYLQELEEDRIRVEEEELEFGEYYDDDEDYNYEVEEDYGEGEYLESDFVVMSENEKEKVDTKDEAVGTEEEEEASNFEEKKSKKGKKFFSLGGPQSAGSSSKGSSSKGSRASLDKQSSKGSSLEGLVEDDTNLEPSNQQSKKFFRFGSLSIKRKKKISDEYSECDPVINKIEKEIPDANEEINTENKLARKNTSHFAKLIVPKGSSEECDLKRKENMLLLLKIIQKHNKASNSMEVGNVTESKDLPIKIFNNNSNNNNSNNSNNNKNNNDNLHEITSINENLGNLSLESKVISDRSRNSSQCSSPCSKNARDLPCTNVETNDWEFLDLGDTETSLRNSSNSKSEKDSGDSLTSKSLLVNEESSEKPTRVLDTRYSNNSPLADDAEEFVFIQTDRKSATNSAAPSPSCHLTSDREIDQCKNRPILTEVSNLKDTEMSRAGGRLATKSTKLIKPTKPTENGGNVKNEELWPEESKSSSKAVFDDFEKMEKEVILEMEKENEEKKLKREGDKKGKKKKKKKTDSEKENKKTAYQNKDELYEKHVGPRIRSFDAAKMKNKFNKPKEPTQVSSDCRICGKQVFQMEKIVAEKASWHKNCFRCKECNKNLTLETYQSHEGSLYCKPHFKELFRPKAVVQDEAEERKERLLRRPKMIVLESNPEQLPDDVVRATSKPDYGLEELQQTLNIQERFAVFENFSKEEEKPRPEPISVRRSQSLMSKAARFFDGQEDGEDYEDDEEECDEEEEEEEEEEEGEGGEEGNEEGSVVKSRNKKKKERPMSFSGMGDLKAAWEQKQRREELSQSRKEEITRFRQMLCAGKNLSLKEKFESGQFDDHENGETNRMKEEIKIEGKRAASNLKKRFEQGEPFILEDDDEVEGEEGTPKRRERIGSEKQEVEEIFKEAETAKKARNVFKQIDSKVSKEGTTILRSQSFASSGRENRHSMDVSVLMQQHREPVGEVVKADEKQEDFSVDTTDLASRFRFFLNYEKEKEKEMEKSRKVFRITPPREGIDQVEDLKISKANMPKPCMAVNCAACKLRRLMGDDDTELLGRDPNLIKCSDNYQDDIDCRNTRNILQMFKKMEMGEEEEEEDEGPKPLKRFTPPPGEENENDETDEEYSDEEYTDDEEEEDESDHASKVRDELLQMLSARKAASLRAKFERWEAEVERKNDINKDKEELGEECMPSLDTAKNLKAMFEHKAIEVAKPVASKPIKQKVNRFV